MRNLAWLGVILHVETNQQCCRLPRSHSPYHTGHGVRQPGWARVGHIGTAWSGAQARVPVSRSRGSPGGANEARGGRLEGGAGWPVGCGRANIYRRAVHVPVCMCARAAPAAGIAGAVAMGELTARARHGSTAAATPGPAAGAGTHPQFPLTVNVSEAHLPAHRPMHVCMAGSAAGPRHPARAWPYSCAYA